MDLLLLIVLVVAVLSLAGWGWGSYGVPRATTVADPVVASPAAPAMSILGIIGLILLVGFLIMLFTGFRVGPPLW